MYLSNILSPPLAKKWGGVKKNLLLAPLAEFVPPHFQNRGAAPVSTTLYCVGILQR